MGSSGGGDCTRRARVGACERLRLKWAIIAFGLAFSGCGARTRLEGSGQAAISAGGSGAGGANVSSAGGGVGGTARSEGNAGVAGSSAGGALAGVGAGGAESPGTAGTAGTAGTSGTGGGSAGMGGTVGIAGGGSAGTGGSAGSAGAAASAGSAGMPPTAIGLALGAFHTCALFDAGRLRCWGSAGYIGAGNLLAIGDDEPAAAAPDVDIGGRVVQISASWYHTCALLDSGNLRCFGSGLSGELGYGNTNNIGDDEAPAAAGDVSVGKVRQVSAGPYHTCAVLAGGSVRCWGRNDHFQLGVSSSETIGDDELPASIPPVEVGGFVTQVAAGFAHTCVLLDTGKVRCWGEGSGGRLGYGNTRTIGDDESPASAGDVDVGGTVVQLQAGLLHTCALLDTGKVRCWGQPNEGRLGYGNLEAIGDDETPASAGDVDVGGPVTQIAVGDYATCALLLGGKLRCWGSGQLGELGHANTEAIGDDETPATAGDVDVGGLATHVDVGFLHACAIFDTGKVRCWGRGATGALGYGNTHDIGDNETPASAGDVSAR